MMGIVQITELIYAHLVRIADELMLKRKNNQGEQPRFPGFKPLLLIVRSKVLLMTLYY